MRKHIMAAVLALFGGLGQDVARAQAVDGPIVHRDTVRAYRTDVYRTTFVGNEEAVISVSGDGDTDLDCYVYDANGNLIAYDDDGSDECYVSWTPRWTGEFLLKVVNRGGVYNRYVLRTN
jgi:hypothetical protein